MKSTEEIIYNMKGTFIIDGKPREMTVREHLDYLKQQREKQEKEQPL